MKINSDLPEFQNRVGSSTAPSRKAGAFEDTLVAKAETTAPPSGIAQGLTKSDLADPAKTEASIQQAVHEIIDKEFGGMCAPDREKLATWLGSDPTMRDAIVRRLTSLAP